LRNILTVWAEIPKRVEIEQLNSYPGFDSNYSDPMWEMLGRSLEVNDPIKVPFGAEAVFFSNLGLHTVVWGPGSMQADGYQTNEGISMTQLAACLCFLQKAIF